MSPELSALTFGVLSALSWGAGDFNGGLATRRANVMGVVLISHGFGLVLLVVVALAWGEPVPLIQDLIWGVLGGISGMIGLIALYRALAAGQMGIAAPVSAVLTAALPVLFSIGSRGLPKNAQLIGFGLALAGLWLISAKGRSSELKGLGLAVLAGLGFGVFFILLDQITEGVVFWPLVAARVASTLFALTIVLTTRRAGWLPDNARLLLIILLSSTLDVAGNVFFVVAAQSGRLDIAAVVSSLYPASTILLARVFLKERLSRLQVAGVLATLAAIVLIAI